MTNPERRSAPAGNGSASEDLAGGRSGTIVPQENLSPRAAPIDLLRLTPFERDVFDAGVTHGYVMGHEAGVQWADDRAATLGREAARIVHALAGLPESPSTNPERDRVRHRLMRRSA